MLSGGTDIDFCSGEYTTLLEISKKTFIKFDDSLVGQNILLANGLFEYNAFEGAAAAESNVGLSVFEGTGAEVNDDFVEGFTLGFVDGDCPGEAQGELAEGADDAALDVGGVGG